MIYLSMHKEDSSIEQNCTETGDILPAGNGCKADSMYADFCSCACVRSIQAGKKQWWLGIIFAGISGICISLFSPSFNIASNDPFHLLKPGVSHMSVYLTNFYFAMGFGIGASK